MYSIYRQFIASPIYQKPSLQNKNAIPIQTRVDLAQRPSPRQSTPLAATLAPLRRPHGQGTRYLRRKTQAKRKETEVDLRMRAPAGPRWRNGRDGTKMSGIRLAVPFRGHNGVPRRDMTSAQGNTLSRTREVGVVSGIAVGEV